MKRRITRRVGSPYAPSQRHVPDGLVEVRRVSTTSMLVRLRSDGATVPDSVVYSFAGATTDRQLRVRALFIKSWFQNQVAAATFKIRTPIPNSTRSLPWPTLISP